MSTPNGVCICFHCPVLFLMSLSAGCWLSSYLRKTFHPDFVLFLHM